MDPITCLPVEINLAIQSYLDRNAVSASCLVSHEWNDLLIDNDYVWHDIFPEIHIPKTLKAKEYLNIHAICSLREINQRIFQFVNKLLLRQKGKFTCHFPFNPNSTLSLKIKFTSLTEGLPLLNGSFDIGQKKPPKAQKLIETYIFMKKINETDTNERADCGLTHILEHKIENSFFYIFDSENKCKIKTTISLPVAKERYVQLFNDSVQWIADRELIIKSEEFYYASAKMEFFKYAVYSSAITTLALSYFYTKPFG